MLSKRKELILKIIIREYIAQPTPVPSERIAKGYPLGISPATVRLEMAELEEEGYVFRPHPSAGGIPSCKAYRYYVEHLEEIAEPPLKEKLLIQHLFRQIGKGVEEWLRTAACLLAQITNYAAVITAPKAVSGYIKRLDLLFIHQFLTLLILLLREGKVKQRFISFDHPVSFEELASVSKRLNEVCCGVSFYQIKGRIFPASPVEEKVVQNLFEIVDEEGYDEPFLYGLSYLFDQPEFSQQQKFLKLMSAIERKRWLRSLIPQEEGIKVIIGEENEEEGMRDCSLVLSLYGIPQEVKGVIGVLGPTRMRYGRVISTVRYISGVLSEMLKEICS